MRSGKPVAVFAVLLVISFATMNAMPSDTLLAALLQEAVLALVALVAVGLAVPDALKRCTQTVQQRSIVRFTAITLLLVGLVGGAITLLAWLFAGGGTMACFASTALPSTADLMENLLLLLGICLLTGLVLVSTMLGNADLQSEIMAGNITAGAALSSAAFASIPYIGTPILIFGMILFAYSTILGWSYYGNRCVTYLFGKRAIRPYQVLYVVVAFLGAIGVGEVVWTVSDITNALMAIPNIIMVLLLSGLIAKETKHYVYEGNLDERDEAPIPQLDSK